MPVPYVVFYLEPVNHLHVLHVFEIFQKIQPVFDWVAILLLN